MLADSSIDYILKICDLYGTPYDDRVSDGKKRHLSLRQFQRLLEEKEGKKLSTAKIQKILITGGRWSTKTMLRDAKSENFVSHWGCGIQYPKCSIETKSVQRRIIDISAFFQISYRNAIHDEQYSGHGFRNLLIPKGKWKDQIFLKWFSAFLLTGRCITINWLNALI